MSVVNLKTKINPTKSWSAFYYHHMQAILNNVSSKVLLPAEPHPLGTALTGLLKN